MIDGMLDITQARTSDSSTIRLIPFPVARRLGCPLVITLFLALCTFLAGTGCSIADLSTPQRMDRGLVIVLPGIEGRSRLNINIARGLDEGDVKIGIEIFDWATAIPGGMLINLTNYERNQRFATKLRGRILDYRRQYPDRSIHVVGHSGGAGLAILAVEKLPRDVQVSSIVLLAPALSPTYDLRRALRRTRYGMYNYYSEHDTGFLVLGTSLFGTIDRDYGASAGAVGFKPPESGDEVEDETDLALFDRLHQIKWVPAMKAYGHGGGHTGWTNRAFVRQYLAPLIIRLTLTREEWPPRDIGEAAHPDGNEEAIW